MLHPKTVMDLIVRYEDEWLMVVDKPSGLLVHRGMGRDQVVLCDLLRNYMGGTAIHPIHRLDRQTSGLLLVGKSSEVARRLQQQLTSHLIEKTYLALVRGAPAKPSGTIDHPVPKGEDKPRVPARSRYKTLATAKTEPRTSSLVAVWPQTGRFHQIRRHLKHLNCPIIGDANYGKGDINRSFRQTYGLCRMALHATRLSFEHPRSGQAITVRAPIPNDLFAPLSNMGFCIHSALTALN